MKADDESLATERHRQLDPQSSKYKPYSFVEDYPSILFLGLELWSLVSSMLGASLEVPKSVDVNVTIILNS